MNIKTLVVATGNQHKLKEIAKILPSNYQILSLADFPPLPEVEETGSTFAENAALKAVENSRHIKGLVLADDSGLCVDALGGAPGINSARYAGVHGADDANNEFLIQNLKALPEGSGPFTGRFVCSICLAEAGQVVASFEDVVEGHITCDIEGVEGFGYDPLFIPLGYERSFGVIDPEIKNRISHRAKALQQVAAYLAQN